MRLPQILLSQKSKSKSHCDWRSVSKFWCRAPSRARDRIFITLWQLRSFLWRSLSDERTGLSFVSAAGFCPRRLSRVRVRWDSRPYFTVSDLKLPFSSSPTTRRVTVEVFDTASTRPAWDLCYINSRRPPQKTQLPNNSSVAREVCSSCGLHRNGSSSVVAYVFISAGNSLLSRCLTMNYSGFQASRYSIIYYLLYLNWFPDMFRHSDAILRGIRSMNTLVKFARGYCTRCYIINHVFNNYFMQLFRSFLINIIFHFLTLWNLF
jgi:hypothetical protein